jgi:WD40 repeat protein
MALSTDGQQLVAATTKQRLQIIDFSTLKTIADLEMPATVTTSQTAVAWRPDGSGLVVATDDGTIVEFLAAADGRFSGPGKTIQTVNSTPLPDRIDNLVFSADANTLLATSTASSSALILHRQAGSSHEFVTTPLAYDDGQSIVSADLSADGRRVAAGTSAGRIAIWNSEPLSKKAISAGVMASVAERELLLMPNLHQSAISAIRFVERENETGVLSAESESGQNEVLFWPAKAKVLPAKE